MNEGSLKNLGKLHFCWSLQGLEVNWRRRCRKNFKALVKDQTVKTINEITWIIKRVRMMTVDWETCWILTWEQIGLRRAK